MDASNLALKQLCRHLAGYQCELSEINNSLLIGSIQNGLLELDYYVDVEDEFYQEILELLAFCDFAPFLSALRLSAPDEGINGTRSWNLEPLTRGEGIYQNLRLLDIQGTQPKHHNRTILGDFAEDGIVAKLLDKMPNLEQLSIPCAPSPAFFDRNPHPLKHLTLQTGYDSQYFILNLSQSTCFSQLKTLDFTDYYETYIPDYEQHKTPIHHYLQLFNSTALPNLETLTLRHSLLNEKDAAELKKTPLGSQLDLLKLIPSS
ncbi:hypothetical protein J0895_11230 [Phormidium pseudopriestleyi FRX01]|uniref:Uncharacterized protein n=1 Tax=Phormidium pseudopriestleyi FRX01 TaxID=1759528 RepID=A0ABS3FRC8_9CYAN|nr:hypothetical protein [Phormidium pseudopriestleyi]MBO0349672.1 hypothetical protein [Phormidium pseudopriestleyi FRX01]